MATVFDRIVFKENDHTNLLRNLLDRNARFAAAVMSEVLERSVTESESAALTFDTQQLFVNDVGREIPDVVITGDEIHCIIEAKIDPFLGLTEGQQNGYRACFVDKKEGALTFLVPDDWKHRTAVDTIRAQYQSQIRVNRLSWSRLIEIGERVSDERPDEVLSDALQFWKWRFQSTLMNADELKVLNGWSPTIYTAIHKLEKTVDQARKLFDARGFTTDPEGGGVEYHGFYIKNEGRFLLWIGVWTEAKIPLAYGYDFRDKATWVKPSEKPANPVTTTKNFYLWGLSSDCWDKPESIYRDVSAILKKYWGLTKET